MAKRFELEKTWGEWSGFHTYLDWVYEGKVRPKNQHMLSLRRRRLGAWLVLKGNVVLTAGGKRMRAGAGQWALFGGTFHRQDFTPDAEILSLSFQVSGMEQLRDSPVVFPAKKYPWLTVSARRLLKSHQTVGWQANTEGNIRQRIRFLEFLRVQKHLAEWVEAYFRARSLVGGDLPLEERNLDPRVAKVLEEVETGELRQVYSEKSLAALVGLSTAHLERLFLREYGETPRKIWEQRRVDEASQRVGWGESSLKQIGYELGFSSQPHFTSWFKKFFGQPPKIYRIKQKKAT